MMSDTLPPDGLAHVWLRARDLQPGDILVRGSETPGGTTRHPFLARWSGRRVVRVDLTADRVQVDLTPPPEAGIVDDRTEDSIAVEADYPLVVMRPVDDRH